MRGLTRVQLPRSQVEAHCNCVVPPPERASTSTPSNFRRVLSSCKIANMLRLHLKKLVAGDSCDKRMSCHVAKESRHRHAKPRLPRSTSNTRLSMASHTSHTFVIASLIRQASPDPREQLAILLVIRRKDASGMESVRNRTHTHVPPFRRLS